MSTDAIRYEKKRLGYILFTGFFALFLLIGVLGGWAVLASIEGAVVATGSVVQEGKNKSIQHNENGIVEKVHVVEGELVSSGTLLVTLDAATIVSEREILRKRLFEMKLKQKRLMATRDSARKFEIPAALALENGVKNELRTLVDVQLKLFRATANRQKNKENQLNERIGHLQKEIKNMNAQILAEKREQRILNKEIKGLNSLKKKGLVGQQRYNRIRRDKTTSDSEISRLQAAISKINGQVAEARLQKIESREALRSEALKELEKVEGAIIELEEKVAAADHRLQRLLIKSPQNGYVHELQLHTAGGTIRAGDTIMQIVPTSKHLIVETKINPRDIDQIKIGASGMVRFSAFNQRTTPTLKAIITFISPDQSFNERTGEVYFISRLAIDAGDIDRLNGQKLLPGMPAEVMIHTTPRTVISFLTKPFSDQINRAFREE